MRTTLVCLIIVLAVIAPALALAASPATVVIAQEVDPTTLDPMNHQELAAANAGINIFDTLLERGTDLKVVPLLAESYKNVAPTVWEFKLHKGIAFHNGEPLDADAVKYSLERLVDPKLKLRGAAFVGPLSHVEIIDPLTVRIHTKTPWPLFESMMAGTLAAIVPPKYYKERDGAHVGKNPVGSGPFKFIRWVKDDRIELAANDQYWRGAPLVKKLVFRPIPDTAVRVAALQTGEIDIAKVPPHLAASIANHPRLSLSTVPSARTVQLLYYTHQFDAQHKLVGPYPGPVADKRVRQAMNSAVDVDEIIKGALDGKGVRLASMLTDKHFGFDPQLKPIKRDLGKAKQLLAEAGFPNGVEMVVNAPRTTGGNELAEALAGQLTKAGIRVDLRLHELGNYLSNLAYVHKAGPAWMITWGVATYDAESIYIPLFRSGKILSNYYNADFDALLDEAQTVMDPKRRLELYSKITRLWIDEAPAMPLYQLIDLYGTAKRIVWKARGDERLKGFDMALKEAQ
jgi:peptide/nickel transport system substrate-binding protein